LSEQKEDTIRGDILEIEDWKQEFSISPKFQGFRSRLNTFSTLQLITPTPSQHCAPNTMALAIRHTKITLPKFKGKGYPNIYIREFNNVCQANRETIEEEKLVLFLVTLKKQALEWYVRHPIGHFATWYGLKDVFILRFREKKNDGEVIDSLSHLKQKRSENVEEFYEPIV
jgi:hypothetical protein